MSRTIEYMVIDIPTNNYRYRFTNMIYDWLDSKRIQLYLGLQYIDCDYLYERLRHIYHMLFYNTEYDILDSEQRTTYDNINFYHDL